MAAPRIAVEQSPPPGAAAPAAAAARRPAGSRRCRRAGQPAFAAASAMRSVPDWMARGGHRDGRAEAARRGGDALVVGGDRSPRARRCDRRSRRPTAASACPPASPAACRGIASRRSGRESRPGTRSALQQRIVGGEGFASSSSITGMPSRIGKASRSARQTSTFASRRCTSGPLQIGQARISSSRVSIIASRYCGAGSGSDGWYVGPSRLAPCRGGRRRGAAAPQQRHDVLDDRPARIRLDPRRDRQLPHAGVGERPAFYGILLRHEDRMIVVEAQFCGSNGWWSGKACSISCSPASRSVCKEPRRVADGRHGMDRRGTKRLERALARDRRTGAAPAGHELHREQPCRARRSRRGGGRGPAGTVEHHEVAAREPHRRLAQRTGRQQPAVAEAARAVDDRDLQVARQARCCRPSSQRMRSHAGAPAAAPRRRPMRATTTTGAPVAARSSAARRRPRADRCRPSTRRGPRPLPP